MVLEPVSTVPARLASGALLVMSMVERLLNKKPAEIIGAQKSLSASSSSFLVSKS